MKNNTKKVKHKPMYKRSGFYFFLVYALLTIAFIIQVFTVNILPLKYALPVSIILLLIVLALYWLELGKKVSKVNRMLGKILIVILSLFLAVGNWYLFKTGSAFSRMTGADKNISVVSVVVLEDSSAKEIEDLKGKRIGTISIGDTETQDKTIEDIEKDLDDNVTTVEYKSYKTYAEDLYDGKVEAILVNEGSRGLFEEKHPDFDNETRVIKEYTYTTEANDISKKVNVTKDPFNVYITGIDTYGTIATVSRSDVNMIATVNPKTKQILLTSIPRDFYIPQSCQGNQKDKLTHTGIFGVECTIDSAEEYFGIDLNYYARVNFSSLVDIVDALGGITVNSPQSFVTRHGGVQVVQGDNSFNGEQTLGFVRERYALSDGDRERGRNQMRAITAIIKKATSPSIITRYSSIMDAVGGSFQTNMSTTEMNSLIKMQIDDMSDWNINQISVSGIGETTWSPANGFNSYVMVPNEKTVKNAVRLINKVENGDAVTDDDVKKQEDIVSKAG